MALQVPTLTATADMKVPIKINAALANPTLTATASITVPVVPQISASIDIPTITAPGILAATVYLSGAIDIPTITAPGTLINAQFAISAAINIPTITAPGSINVVPIITGTVDIPTITAPGVLYIPVEASGAIDIPTITFSPATIYRTPLSDLWAARPINEIYSCVIDADGFDPVTLPISSWQARFRTDDAQSYVSVVVPGIAYADQITDREAGTITIYKGYNFIDTGEQFLTEIIEADIDSISDGEGARSASITITGYTTLTENPKAVAINELFYRATNPDGSNRWRTKLWLDIDSESGDFFIKPGDTVTYDGDSITVNYISISVSRIQENMEITSS